MAYTGVEEVAFLARGFEQVKDAECDPAALCMAATGAIADIGGGVHAPADYRRHIAIVAAVRAVETACERAGS